MCRLVTEFCIQLDSHFDTSRNDELSGGKENRYEYFGKRKKTRRERIDSIFSNSNPYFFLIQNKVPSLNVTTC